MEAICEQNREMRIFENIDSVEVVDNRTIQITKHENIKTFRGSIVNISNCEYISVSDYFGEEIDFVDTSDIVELTESEITMFARGIQQISNRVIIELQDGSEIEINGRITGGYV